VVEVQGGEMHLAPEGKVGIFKARGVYIDKRERFAPSNLIGIKRKAP
jgi:hypothetical protein